MSEHTTAKLAQFIVNKTTKVDDETWPTSPSDQEIQCRLKAIGYDVEPLASRKADASKVIAQNYALIIISASADESVLKDQFRDVTVPVVVLNSELYKEMGLTGRSEVNQYGEDPDQTEVIIKNSSHPMAADLAGSIKLSDKPILIAWGNPAKDAAKIAGLTRALDNKIVLFGYDDGQVMVGLNAPARRVGLFFNKALAAQKNSDYWRLFDAAIDWAAGDRPRRFTDVFRAEWKEIEERRQRVLDNGSPPTNAPLTRPPENLVGLALSGGGIRAATFSLGLLQGLHDLGVLRIFDYLSTVSGGGYIGGWWSAWLHRKPNGTGARRDIFPSAEKIEPVGYLEQRAKNVEDRNGTRRPMVSEEAMDNVLSAGNDPIHHLRLFANYLTPRKGALSSDTWRAITVIGRNLLLTWAILLPLLVVAILLGKLYFALQPYAYDPTSPNAFLLSEPSSGDVLRARLMLAAWPLIGLAGWIVAMTCAWMLFNRDGDETRRDKYASVLGTVIVFILAALLGLIIYDSYKLHLEQNGQSLVIYWWWVVLWAAGLILLLLYAFLPVVMKKVFGDNIKSAVQWEREVLRTRIVRTHSLLLALFVLLAFVLALAGFGHELVNYLLTPSNKFSNEFVAYVAKSGGWIALIVTIAGSVFTAVKTSPAGGGDSRETKKPSLLSRAVFKCTPPLVVIMLAIAASWLVNLLLGYLANHYTTTDPDQLLSKSASSHIIQILTIATYLGVVFSFFLILVETKFRRNWPFRVLSGFWTGFAAVAALTLASVFVLTITRLPLDENRSALYAFTDWNWYFGWLPVWLILSVTAAGGAVLCFRLTGDDKRRLRSTLWAIIFAAAWVLLNAGVFWEIRNIYNGLQDSLVLPAWMAFFIFGGIALCLVFSVFEASAGKGTNLRPLLLLGAVCLILTSLLFLELLVSYTYALVSAAATVDAKVADVYYRFLFAEAIFMLISASLSWVVAMGWMADPNGLSMHSFYKSRLVRAYLGASNKIRSEQRKTVTEAVEGDDVLLQDLQNCQRGAPYHLINTTLNMVGGRDLTTAQRLAASFLLSKRYCGSSRTGYRDTREYMGGQFSLGTAVAVSGAAASPNMGTKTLTSSLAMLMTFLNVRLGYWAPTPNKQDWRAPKARLWPFYMMREFLSQTNDLSPYCYLTDGGHFDNTGLYSLVERGCRFIVVADCGADPKPCFQDIGDVIRRCRIDFGAEFELDITPLMKDKKSGRAKGHFVVGKIIYSRAHAETFNWNLIPEEELSVKEKADQDEEARTGIIILFKPVITNKEESADVKQYKLENDDFPQQKTLDQWYDEAQFESYRQLGKLYADLAFDHLSASEKFKALGGKFSLGDVKRLFEEVRDQAGAKSSSPVGQQNGDRRLVSAAGWWNMQFIQE